MSAHANRFYSPGVDAGDYVYISGQGPRRPDGSSPATFEAQVRQALDNVKAIVESAGLTMEHVVYTQVYLQDISQYGEMNKVFAEYFAKTPPARAVLGVAGIPESSGSDQCGRGAQFSGQASCLSAELQVRGSRFAGHPHSRPAFRFQHARQ